MSKDILKAGVGMEALRAVIKPDKELYSIQLPHWAIGQEVELIILATGRKKPTGGVAKRFDGLFDNPVNVKEYVKLDRDALHDRKSIC